VSWRFVDAKDQLGTPNNRSWLKRQEHPCPNSKADHALQAVQPGSRTCVCCRCWSGAVKRCAWNLPARKGLRARAVPARALCAELECLFGCAPLQVTTPDLQDYKYWWWQCPGPNLQQCSQVVQAAHHSCCHNNCVPTWKHQPENQTCAKPEIDLLSETLDAKRPVTYASASVLLTSLCCHTRPESQRC